MPWKPKHPCAVPGCPALTYGRHCPAHQAAQRRIEDQRRPSAAKRGYGARHRKLRATVLQRDPICKICRQAFSTVRDHIIPLEQGGEDTLENSQGVCESCHNRKTATQDRGFGRKKMAPRE